MYFAKADVDRTEGVLLFNHISKELGVSAEQAEVELSWCLGRLRSELDGNRVCLLPGLGRMKSTSQYDYFFVPDDGLDICPEAFGLKPVAVRELKPNGKKGHRYILDFMIMPRQRIFVKAAVSSKSLEDARAKFAADDPAKGFFDWVDAAKADWKAFFETIPHDGTDEEHKAFYTDRYFEETK